MLIADHLGLHTFGLSNRTLVIVLMADHLMFHTNVHFQQVKTMSKGRSSSAELVICVYAIL